MSKYRVYSGLYVAVFELNTGKYGPNKTPYLDTFHAMHLFIQIEQAIENNIDIAIIRDLEHFYSHDHHGTHNDMIVQIIDFCDPNDQEKRENFWMHKLRTLYPDGLNHKKINQ